MLISLASLAGCTASSFTPPQFEEPLSLPPEITVNQISSDYAADEAAADTKYSGEELLFYEVVVEEAQITSTRTKFTSGGVIFIVGASFTARNIEPGFILNIEGEYNGGSVLENLPTIIVSWVESVEGDIGLTVPVGSNY